LVTVTNCQPQCPRPGPRPPREFSIPQARVLHRHEDAPRAGVVTRFAQYLTELPIRLWPEAVSLPPQPLQPALRVGWPCPDSCVDKSVEMKHASRRPTVCVIGKWTDGRMLEVEPHRQSWPCRRLGFLVAFGFELRRKIFPKERSSNRRLFCIHLLVEGEVRLVAGEIDGAIECTKGTFKNTGGFALSAHGIKVSGSVSLGESCTFDGEVNFVRANIEEESSGGCSKCDE
jgi:hypothetical protein